MIHHFHTLEYGVLLGRLPQHSMTNQKNLGRQAPPAGIEPAPPDLQPGVQPLYESGI